MAINRVDAQAAMSVITIVLIFSNVIVYLVGTVLAKVMNRIAKRKMVSPRILGSVGIVLFSGIVAGCFNAFFVDENVLKSLSPYAQGKYAGEIDGRALAPAIMVLVVVAVRGWLASRKKPSEMQSRVANSFFIFVGVFGFFLLYAIAGSLVSSKANFSGATAIRASMHVETRLQAKSTYFNKKLPVLAIKDV